MYIFLEEAMANNDFLRKGGGEGFSASEVIFI